MVLDPFLTPLNVSMITWKNGIEIDEMGSGTDEVISALLLVIAKKWEVLSWNGAGLKPENDASDS